MARYCVTGATGFIGANLVARLKERGHWVRAVDIKKTPLRADLYEQADEVWTWFDLREYWDAEEALTGVDRVFHLAADHGGAGYFHGKWDFKAAMNNQAIDRNVIDVAMGRNIERLVFAGSACTYPIAIQGKDAQPLKESSFGQAPVEALYGEAKRMSTLIFEGSREHGLDARTAIFHTIYGPGQDYKEPRAKFPTALCRKLIKNPKRVEIWGDGTQVRTFLFIDDALDRLEAMMDKSYHGWTNLGSDEEVTVMQCALWASESASVTPEWVFTDGPTGVAHRASDNALWNERYGAGKLTTPKEGFAKTYEWLKAELAKP